MVMIVKEWDLRVVDFVVKFCIGGIKYKFKFMAYDEEKDDMVIKTLIINEDKYENIPEVILLMEIKQINVDDNFLVIELKGNVDSKNLNDIKKRKYTFT